MTDYLGNRIRYRSSALDDWEYGTVVQELPSPVSGGVVQEHHLPCTGEIDRLLVAMEDWKGLTAGGAVIVSTLAVVPLHLAQVQVLDPMAPDYDALAAEEPTSQLGDSRDAAGVL